jgi:hydroxylaminobenzene mutase
MLLFLFGLVTGLVEQHFANMRMGLAAHLEGVMNGTFLLARLSQLRAFFGFFRAP